MNLKLIFTGISVVIVVSIGVVVYFAKGSVVQPGSQAAGADSKTMTIAGKMTCLTPKATNGAATMSCAIGLAGDDGKNYALNADDPTVTGSVPTGKRVTVTGTLSEQASQYDAVGVIKVDELREWVNR
jgi:hypothetical protein